MSPIDECAIDRARAYVEGTLSPARRAAFEREMARDPALAEAVVTYGDVWTATAADDLPVPACRLAGDDLRLDAAPANRVLGVPRRVAAAAAILLVGGAVAAFSLAGLGGSGGRGIVEGPGGLVAAAAVSLKAVPLERPAILADALPAAPPPEVEHYGPSESGALAFLEDLDQAREVARVARRPLLAFAFHPTCPWCQELKKGPFHEASVLAAAEPFVLVRLDVTKTPQSVLGDVVGKYWPAFWIEDVAGARTAAFGGDVQTGENLGLAALQKALADGAKASPPAKDALPWEVLRTLARRLADAERDADPARRCAGLAEVGTRDAGDGKGVLGVRARHLLAETAEAARTALLAARDAAAQDGAAAGVKALDAAAPAFAGTPFGADLAAVRARLVADGAFPRLEAPPPTPPVSKDGR